MKKLSQGGPSESARMQKQTNEWTNPDAVAPKAAKSQQELVNEAKKVLNEKSKRYLQQLVEKYGNLKAIAEDAARYILTFKDNMKYYLDKNSGMMSFASMSLSIREAQMQPEHKELLGTSQVYIHSSTYLNDIRKAVDVVNSTNPEAIKRISDIIEDSTIGYSTLGQYLHPVMTAPTPDQLKNVSGVIKLNMEAIKKEQESQTPEGFINKIADVIIHESEHKHDVETTGSSNESHPEQKEKEFMQKMEQSMPQQTYASIITIKASMRSHKESVELFGQPVQGKTYNCELQSFTSGKILVEDLVWVDEDDVGWRTADDNAEINNNWLVISWKQKPEQSTPVMASIKKAMPEFHEDMDELAKDKKGMRHFIKNVLPKIEPTEEEKEMRDYIKKEVLNKKASPDLTRYIEKKKREIEEKKKENDNKKEDIIKRLQENKGKHIDKTAVLFEPAFDSLKKHLKNKKEQQNVDEANKTHNTETEDGCISTRDEE